MSAQNNTHDLERYLKSWEASKAIFYGQSGNSLSGVFDDAKLKLVISPYSHVQKSIIAENVELIDCSQYALDTNLGISNAEEVWGCFLGKGYCTYDKNAVYIGYPYENQDIPLERAIIHELGHHVQKKQGYVYIPNDNTFNTILEYHNIMFHENLSDCQGTYYKLYVIGKEFNGKRYNYSRSECLGYEEDLATMRNTEKLSKLGLLTTSLDELKRKLSGEFSGNALLGQMLDVTTEEMSLNHVLLFNCYRELRNIK